MSYRCTKDNVSNTWRYVCFFNKCVHAHFVLIPIFIDLSLFQQCLCNTVVAGDSCLSSGGELNLGVT